MTPWTTPHVRAILSIIADLDSESYVVGGAIRDSILGTHSPVDLDLAVKGNGFEIARRVSDSLGNAARFVALDEGRGTARIVLKGDQAGTLDISSFKGIDIEDDLFHRDFTINAVAVKVSHLLQSGLEHLLDPTGGLPDIREKRIRACSQESFQEDPVRILRAFRFRSNLGFSITPDTMAMIPRSLGNLANQSAERVRDEFFAVLSGRAAGNMLKEMDRHGVSTVLFPEVLPLKGCRQNDYHHLDVWGHTILTVEGIDAIASGSVSALEDMQGYLHDYLSAEPVKGRSRGGLLRLAALFHDSGKPHCAKVEDKGRIRFFGHERISLDIFHRVGRRLQLAKRETRVVGSWIQGHMRTMVLLHEPLSKRAVLRLFNLFGDEIVGLLLLFLADLAASRGPARKQGEEAFACGRVREVLGCYLRREPPCKPLVNGRDLMDLLGIAPGPQLGNLLRHLADLQRCDELHTRDQAIALAKAWMEKYYRS